MPVRVGVPRKFAKNAPISRHTVRALTAPAKRGRPRPGPTVWQKELHNGRGGGLGGCGIRRNPAAPGALAGWSALGVPGSGEARLSAPTRHDAPPWSVALRWWPSWAFKRGVRYSDNGRRRPAAPAGPKPRCLFARRQRPGERSGEALALTQPDTESSRFLY